MFIVIICVHCYKDSWYSCEEIEVFIKTISNFSKFFAYNLQNSQYQRMLFSGLMTYNIVHNTLQPELKNNNYGMKNEQFY